MDVHRHPNRDVLRRLQNEVTEKVASAKEAKASRQSKAAAKRAARQAEKGAHAVGARSVSPTDNVYFCMAPVT